jgi:hypothetical protein
MTQDVLLIDRAFEQRLGLVELLQGKFRVIQATSSLFDLSLPRLSTYVLFYEPAMDPAAFTEAIRKAASDGLGRIVLVHFLTAFETISHLSLALADLAIKVVPVWDRFDMATYIEQIMDAEEFDDTAAEPTELVHLKLQRALASLDRGASIELVSLMTWKKSPLAHDECTVLLDHFGSVKAILDLSRDEFDSLADSLPIQPETKESLSAFLSRQDLYIQ